MFINILLFVYVYQYMLLNTFVFISLLVYVYKRMFHIIFLSL